MPRAGHEQDSRLNRLAEEQAALRRVATLVARGVTPEELFSVVSAEIGRLFQAEAAIARLEPDSSAQVVVGLTEGIPHLSVGVRWELEDFLASTEVYRTGRPARNYWKEFRGASGPVADSLRRMDFVSTVAAPITVEGDVWGVMTVSHAREELPPDTEERMQRFTELVATAVANAESRASLARLADEQAALRRVAELVARGARPDEVFSAVGTEVGRLFGTAMVSVSRFEAGGSALVIVGVGEDARAVPTGSRFELEDANAAALVYKTGRPGRTDLSDYEGAPGPFANRIRELGLVSVVSTPIVVEGDLWGVITIADRNERLPADTEDRLAKFTRLVATAVATAESRDALARLAKEQAALRRVAELVAQGASPEEVFSAVSNEVGRVFGSEHAAVARFEPDGSATVIVGVSEGFGGMSVGMRWELEEGLGSTEVYRTGRPARMDPGSFRSPSGPMAEWIHDLGLVSGVSAPIVVEGQLWGLTSVAQRDERLPADTEARLEKFAELVATAIANAESRAELSASEARALDLANEQAALRRVATLVAEGASAETLFSAVAQEVAGVIDMPVVGVHRFDDETAFTTVGIAGDTVFTLGSRWPVPELGLAARILATGRPARKDDYAEMRGPVGSAMRDDRMVSAVAVPIVVEGNIWGFVVAGGRPGDPIPVDTEDRLARFTELVATAIANSQARQRLGELVEEQAALRRVATLVARGAIPDEVFSAVSNEVGNLFGSDQAAVARFEQDGSGMVVVGATTAIRGVSVGVRWPLEEFLLSTAVHRTGRPARNDRVSFEDATGPEADTLREIGAVSTVAAPIVVGGGVWGVMTVSDLSKPLPADAERRLENFTELVATAIANAKGRSELATSEARALGLAREQAALRRVATLIAQSANAEEVLSAVVAEVAEVFGVELVTICRYEVDEMLVLCSTGVPAFPAGSRWTLSAPSLPASVHTTGAPVRIDDFTDALGLDAMARDTGVKSAVGVPIIVDGAVWGSINLATIRDERLPADTEERLARFTALIATSVSNATMRGELAASRARVIAAADESRRRIERDLHDGAQQQLVTLAVALHRAEGRIPMGFDEVRGDVSRVADGLTDAIQELRDLSRGIHPAILTEGGLSPALKALGRRASVRVKLDIHLEDRLPDPVEVAVYYIVSEALTNASKHSDAARVWVTLGEEAGTLRLSVRDDGGGGADPTLGSGLIGLKDRVEALGGTIGIESPTGRGTQIDVEIPLFPSSG